MKRWRLVGTVRGAAVALATFGLVVAASGCNSAPAIPFRPVADVKQLMGSMLEPAADVYWDAVGTIVDETGSHDFSPVSIEDWDTVRNSAFVIAESGNLLMMPTRAKDGGDWMTMSRGLVEAGQRAIRAAEAKDTAAVFDIGAEVYDACTTCHAKYAVDLVRPNAPSE